MSRRQRTSAHILWAVALMLLLLTAAPAAGQTSDPLPLRVEDTDVTGHPEVVLTVSVPSEFVGTNIDPDAFTVVEDGIVVATGVTRLPSDDLEVVLVLDTSGSMAGSPLAAAQSAALSFVEAMPAGVNVAVVTFADGTAAASGFTTEVDETTAVVLGIRASGETALYDGLLVAAEQFDPATQARRTVILLSDGGDTVSEATLEHALVALIDGGISFYAIELQTAENDPVALARIAAATGGTIVAATDPDALEGIFDEIAAQLINRYQLTYVSEAFGPVAVAISVEVEGTTAATTETLRLPAAPAPVEPAVEPEPAPEPVPAAPRAGSFVELTLWQQSTSFYLALLLTAAGLVGVAFATRGMQVRKKKSVLSDDMPKARMTSSPALSGIAGRAVGLAERSLQGERGGRINSWLEKAGISMRPAEFVVLAAIATIVGIALGYLILRIPGAVVGGLLALLLVRLVVQRKAAKRQAAFAEQLPDSLHLISGSLRAGFGLLQAIEVIGSEAPSPTAEEFRRVKVEVHLGRDLDDALGAMAKRVGSEDFAWVTDGIQIHREVGGDIAEIIDSVNSTIRARNQIRRRIRALSAEGRASAIVLILLPVVLIVFITLVNPDYIGELTGSSIGRLLIAFSAAAMVVGVIWIKRIVRLEF